MSYKPSIFETVEVQNWTTRTLIANNPAIRTISLNALLAPRPLTGTWGVPAAIPVAVPTYSDGVLADTPLAYYRLGEASGTTMVDSSGNGRNGTYLNSPTLGLTGALAGDANKAMGITANTAGTASVANAAWMNTTTIAVEAWVYLTSATDGVNGDALVSRYHSTGYNWLLWRNPSGQLAAQAVVGGATLNANTGVTAALNTWYHLVLRVDGTNMQLLLNGVIAHTFAAAGVLATGPTDIEIGRYSQAASTTPGAIIDEVAIYSNLSASRAVAHYVAGRPTAPGVPPITSYVWSSEFSGSFSAANAFNLALSQWFTASGTPTGYVGAKYASPFAAKAYYVTIDTVTRAPAAWTFEGSNDNINWVVLDTRSGQTTWVFHETRYYSFANTNHYTHYRLNITANNGDSIVGLMEFYVSDVVASAGTTAYPLAVLADSPAWYVRFSETQGGVAEDQSGNHRTPVWLGGSYARNTAGLTTDGDKALTLSTGYGNVLLWPPPGVTFSGAITAEAIIKLSSLPTYSVILSQDDGGGGRNWEFRVDPNGALTAYWWSTAGAGPTALNSAAGTIVVGTKYHVAFTHTGSTATLYVNGVSVGTLSAANGVRSLTTTNLGVGTDTQGANFRFNGVIDECAIYNTALSGARIAAHAAAM